MNAFRIGKYTEEEKNKYKKHIQMHLPESDILKLEFALATDPFFSGLKKTVEWITIEMKSDNFCSIMKR